MAETGPPNTEKGMIGIEAAKIIPKTPKIPFTTDQSPDQNEPSLNGPNPHFDRAGIAINQKK
ncbi:hypothetical protein GCM10011511_53990 [Puia dinghuensis]|uniref:Uncharacterized protein n=1 Tax=Puia dinghuensis TaxID=1792502 RepID=A0A8J2UIM4_9BACT|nr:hypothetical protein GCM10011511_53990 [Puia dinghuensis]